MGVLYPDLRNRLDALGVKQQSLASTVPDEEVSAIEWNLTLIASVVYLDENSVAIGDFVDTIETYLQMRLGSAAYVSTGELRDRATHTGVQGMNSISGLDAAFSSVSLQITALQNTDSDLQTQIDNLETGGLSYIAEDVANKNQTNGYAGLDSDTLLFLSQIPSLAAQYATQAQRTSLLNSIADLGVEVDAAQNDITTLYATKQNSLGFTPVNAGGPEWQDLTDLGQSILHYHAADRDRTNHSGQQPISSVAGLQSALDEKQPLFPSTPLFATDTNWIDLTDMGETALHYHASDRNRNNHTGFQAISTVLGLQSALDSKQPVLGYTPVSNSESNWIELTDNGDTSIHYHSSDRARSNHTGTQAISTVVGLQGALDGKEPLLGFTPESVLNRDVVYPTLSSGKLQAGHMTNVIGLAGLVGVPDDLAPVAGNFFRHNGTEWRASGIQAGDIPFLPQYELTENLGTAAYLDVGSANGNLVALGVDGKFPVAVMPEITITRPFVVADEEAMLLLDAQIGDVAIRADGAGTFILSDDDPTDVDNWVQMASAAGGVTSFNGEVGSVVLSSAHVLAALGAQVAGKVFAGPASGANALAAFRSLLATDLPDLSDEYVALDNVIWTDLTDNGETTRHYHSSDRARGNHTGTQLSTSISDLATAVYTKLKNALVQGSNVTLTPNDGAETVTVAGNPGFTNPMTTPWDMIVGGTGGAATRWAIGANGKILGVVASELAWIDPPEGGGGFESPMTTTGDMIYGGASGVAQRRGIGNSNDVLTVVAGLPTWVPPAFANPMTAASDLIVGGASGVPERKAKGSEGTYLGIQGGVLTYVDEPLTGGSFAMYDPDKPPTTSIPFYDEFEQSTLDVAWSVYDPAAARLTITTSDGLLKISNVPPASNGDNWRGIAQALPGGDWALVTKMAVPQTPGTSMFGLNLWAGAPSSSQALVAFGFLHDTGAAGYFIRALRYTNPTTFAANLGSTPITVDITEISGYLKIVKIATTYSFYYSRDGLTWILQYSGDITIVPTYFGLGSDNWAIANPTVDIYSHYIRVYATDPGRLGGRRMLNSLGGGASQTAQYNSGTDVSITIVDDLLTLYAPDASPTARGLVTTGAQSFGGLKTFPNGISAKGVYGTWSEVTGTTQAMAVNTAYIANNAGLVTFTFPSVAAVGDRVLVIGKGAGGWRVAQNAGQQTHFGVLSTTSGTGGYVESTHRRDVIEFVCVTVNTEWSVTGPVGSITVA